MTRLTPLSGVTPPWQCLAPPSHFASLVMRALGSPGLVSGQDVTSEPFRVPALVSAPQAGKTSSPVGEATPAAAGPHLSGWHSFVPDLVRLSGSSRAGERPRFGGDSAVSLLCRGHKAAGVALKSLCPQGRALGEELRRSCRGAGTGAAVWPCSPSALPGPILAGMLTWYAAQQDASRFLSFEGELGTRSGLFILH